MADVSTKYCDVFLNVECFSKAIYVTLLNINDQYHGMTQTVMQIHIPVVIKSVVLVPLHHLYNVADENIASLSSVVF